MLDVEISPAEAAQFLRQEDARLVYVREPWEFAATRHFDAVSGMNIAFNVCEFRCGTGTRGTNICFDLPPT